jgi:dihydrofolate reductase
MENMLADTRRRRVEPETARDRPTGTVRVPATRATGGGVVELSYVTNVSVDGYIEDADGGFDWTEPSDEFFAFITDLVRPVGTWLYGRRLYEAMAVWETDPALAAQSELFADFARVWQTGEKVVYSTTLQKVTTANTRLQRAFDPEAVRAMKASAVAPLTIGGANLAAEAFAAGLVDECHLFVHPIVVGRGKPAFITDAHVPLELEDERRLDGGVLYLHYRTRT